MKYDNKIEQNIKKNKIIRCTMCNKKCTLINYTCKCLGIFCQNHRLSHTHKCVYIDKKKKEIKNMIKENNPKMISSKVEKI